MRLLALPLLFVVSFAASAQQSVAVSDLTLTLPDDWTGAVVSDEAHAPYSSSYTFQNTNEASSLHGAGLVIHRIIGFDRFGLVHTGHSSRKGAAPDVQHYLCVFQSEVSVLSGVALEGRAGLRPDELPNIMIIQEGTEVTVG